MMIPDQVRKFAGVPTLLGSVLGLALAWWVRTQVALPIDAIGPTQSETLREFSRFVSAVTTPSALLLVVLVGTFLAAEIHHIRAWIHITVGIAVAALCSYLIKEVTGISRPADMLEISVSFSHYSFPSSHTTAATTLAGLSIFHVSRFWPDKSRFIIPVITVGALVVLISRVLLGVHTISDVIGGVFLGIAVTSLGIMLWSYVCRLLDKLPLSV